MVLCFFNSNVEKHIQEARDMFQIGETLHFRAKCFPESNTYYLDHMASKPIPKHRKDTAEAWSKDHLVLHLAGSYMSKTDAVHYSVYPELVSEQANTIITQIDAIIKASRTKQIQLKQTNFIMDNHATQKNSYVFAYFEWLAKSGVIGKDGMPTLVVCP
jgi:hypothetical protein